jgi:tricarballylate dehydrogenase
MRVAYLDEHKLRALMPDMSNDEWERSDFGKYSEADFYSDLASSSDYRADPDLTETVVDRSYETLSWLRDQKVRFVPQYGLSSVMSGGMNVFVGGLAVQVSGGGSGLVNALATSAEVMGVEFLYSHRAVSVDSTRDGYSVSLIGPGSESRTLSARAVIIATGGFEANAEWRARYLGRDWDLARVRGCRYNTGDGIRMALAAGAVSSGNWSGCHAAPIDMNAPDFGASEDSYRYSYPLGIMVNNAGVRFVDEGRGFWQYTYSDLGRVILDQPSQVAWQIFDSRTIPFLRSEYRTKGVTKVSGDSLDQLLDRLGREGVDTRTLASTIKSFNSSTDGESPVSPGELDGRATFGIAPPKSNWATPLSFPPFEAYAVTCGITYTYGGIRVNTRAEVVDVSTSPVPGLYAAGEIVGGLYYHNCPAGVGLTSGATLGRIAGKSAAEHALRQKS